MPFVERDVSRDSQAMEELSQLGYLTTPLARIDGEIVVGFDRKRLEELLS